MCLLAGEQPQSAQGERHCWQLRDFFEDVCIMKKIQFLNREKGISAERDASAATRITVIFAD